MFNYKSFSQDSFRVQFLSDEELMRQLDDSKQQVRILKIENEVLERALARLDPNLLSGLQQTVDYAVKLHSNSMSSINLTYKKSCTKLFDAVSSLTNSQITRIQGSPSRLSSKHESCGRLASTVLLSSGPKVNILERSEILSNEMELIVKCVKKEAKKADGQHAVLAAQLEELALREADIQKAMESFERDVCQSGWDRIAQRISAEVWVRFMREWIKESDAVTGKLRLRTATLNSMHGHLKSKIKEISELSANLRPVDFEKIKIENEVKKLLIDDKIHHVAELKKMTGEANLNVSRHKNAMYKQNNYLAKVKNYVKNRECQTTRLKRERGLIQEQTVKISQQLERVRKIKAVHHVPDVMEYVNVKAEVTDLKHVIKVLGNRIHIHQVALRSLNKKLHEMGDVSENSGNIDEFPQ